MTERRLSTILNRKSKFATRYFVFKYNKLPFVKAFRLRVNPSGFKKDLMNLYPQPVFDLIHNYGQGYNKSTGWEMQEDGIFCHLKEGLILQYEGWEFTICHDNTISDEEIARIQELIVNNREKTKKHSHKFSMIKKAEFGGFTLSEFKIKAGGLNVSENYNDDLVSMNPEIISFIKSKNKSGIILFHGVPGGGKTSYIRSLISNCNTRFIYIPNNLFCHISDPDFMEFISSFPNSVIILEDCEELLKAREQNNSGNGISNLLNLGDGLLGDALKLKIICTFNSDLAKVDEALLRKGRLMYRYEFKKLEVVKTNALLKKLNVNETVAEPMTLAEIFNMSHNNNSEVSETKAIGFGV